MLIDKNLTEFKQAIFDRLDELKDSWTPKIIEVDEETSWDDDDMLALDPEKIITDYCWDDDEDEEECDCDDPNCGCWDDDEDELDERKVVVKVSSTGQRRKKVVCGPGKKFDGQKCVIITSKERLARRKGALKAKRSRRAGQRQANVKRVRALKKRKSQGL